MRENRYQCCLKEVNADLEYQKRLKEDYSRKLYSYEKNKNQRLLRTTVNGYPYYYLKDRTSLKDAKQSTSKRVYLGNEKHPLVQKLLQRDYYEAALRDIEANIRWLETLLKKYRSVNPNVRLEELAAKHHLKHKNRIFGPSFYDDAGAIDVSAWSAAEYPRSRSYPEQLIHKTMRGEYVRSKSEVIIANALYQAGIPYRYEQITEFGSVIIAADFIVLSVRRQKFLVWEHFGRMNDPKYQKTYLWKLRKYAKAGLVVGVDLLTTFDDVDGAIDTGQIKKYIEEVIL